MLIQELSTSTIGSGSVAAGFYPPLSLFLEHSPRELSFPS